MIIAKKTKKNLSKGLFLANLMFLTILIIIILVINSNSAEKAIFKSNNVSKLVPETTNISYVESSDGKMVPIPKGYTASKIAEETSVNGGFVIYEGDINWDSTEMQTIINLANTGSKEKELLQLQSSYNQYVWIPVDEEKIKTIYGVDENGKLWGKIYSYNSLERVPQNWSERNGNFSISVMTNYFEPGLGYGANTAIVNEITLQTMLNQNREELIRELELNYYEAIKSIKKYGGFYIGRYETGMLEGKSVIRRMNEDLSKQNWADLYQKTKKMQGEKENVKTSMIWSSLWDYTIQWLIDTGAKTYETVYSSDSWGNYRSSKFQYYTDKQANITTKSSGSLNAKVIPAGSSDYTKANNIYDMAGNVNELTLGSYGQYFSSRGGYYNSSTTTEKSCAFRSYQSISDSTERTGSRAILLLK